MDERLITVVETRAFQQRAETRMSDAEREEFINFIAGCPEDGDLMQGTGGVRKSRWAVASRGKRSGVRVVYYYYNPTMPIFLLTVFAKNEQDNVPHRERNLLKQHVRELVKSYAT
jgi:hypothetical protein